MKFFWLLLLAHIIADFPLQTDYVFQLKQTKKWGVLLHGLIHFGFTAILFFPLWKSPNLWIGIVTILVSHILVDKYKLKLRYSRLTKSFIYFWFDQLIHVLIIVFVSHILLKDIKVTFFASFYQNFFFNIRLQIVLCASMFIIFGSTFLVYYGRLVWENIKPANRTFIISFPTIRSRLIGYIERTFSILLVMIGGNFALLVPGIYLVRILYCWNKSYDRRYLFVNYIISILFILTFYLLFYQN